MTVKIPQMFIPFYYLLVSGEENHPKDSRISVSVDGQKTVSINHSITQVSVHISDEDYHGWRIDLPDWIYLENNIGKGTKNIIVTVKKNTRKSARRGYIVITDLKTDDVHEIEINQEAKPEN